jgi:hypothetical protein
MQTLKWHVSIAQPLHARRPERMHLQTLNDTTTQRIDLYTKDGLRRTAPARLMAIGIPCWHTEGHGHPLCTLLIALSLPLPA